MSFEDVKDLMTVSVSIDGGSTWLPPFSPIAIPFTGTESFGLIGGLPALLPLLHYLIHFTGSVLEGV
jgi:hypothetical protein